MPKIAFEKRYREGERSDFGYGRAYYDYASRENICYPVPLNFIIGILRSLYFVLGRGPKTKLDYLLKEAFDSGRASDTRQIEIIRISIQKEDYLRGYQKALDDLEEKIGKHQ